ncbi:aspartyl/asparaginyl beta-hydroxylase domain-containing protein [Pseudomonas gingeri]|uniref:Aspartyl/asparaginyl beta-hydroxylase domain-containing protein n=1 Tax=Pseudomonas gingeri TaxID=117681 RepID=A0A7Y7Y707_9PSED|nr:aspartyl/asparaginyl beta-hydroxylase domain-containing protein [Pseudomonas gingeri]NWB31739.1 aspartyl/asparaginyl beta-hydroxylase domain-containing protein [Pseudomonas gingeri]NWC30971.1 aspartyl/asparaginyl beta-hydroxylase domain-containing protein [Pseudomonas gingeri]NWE29609.1 aspartyl/asparaginyl beta-hydroxylase domain-containing protein [Pseudomonas gingeri]NWE98771.1 aspartyl/asparaginyl beta-hydroxylase domain-containing protein [Pseudomonas gingeri]
MSLPAFSRLPVAVALPLLLQALSRIAGPAWKAHFNADYYDGDWSGVALISAADALSELAPGTGAATARAPWLLDSAWATALDLPLEIRSARLLRLGPGGRIHEHRDYDLGAPDADRRLHIPLLSPPDVDFMLDGQRIPMQAGECWFLDLSRPHSVDNWGGGERIHLVLDCRPNPWLEQQIASGLATTPAPGIGRAAADFARFRALLENHPSLCQALQALEDSEAFIARTLQLAGESGLRFGREDIRSAMRQGRSRWNQQWTV